MIQIKIRRIAYSLLILLLFVTLSIAKETAPQQVVQAAMDGLDSFLKAIPSNELGHYGFSEGEDLTKATLGEAFRVYTITPDKILNFDSQQQLSSLVSPTDLWFFPVLYSGEIRTILTVDKMNGEWQAVAIGSAGLARQLKNAADQLSDNEYKFIRIYQARSDIIALSKEGTEQLIPLESARMALKIDKKVSRLFSPSEIIPKLIPVVRQNIKSDEAIEH